MTADPAHTPSESHAHAASLAGAAADQPDSDSDPALAQTRTRLNPRWVLKMAIFFVAVAGLGLWAVYDGLVAFPARGREAASFAEWQYLQAVRDAGALSRASVENPQQALEDLRARRNELLASLDSAQAAGRATEAARSALEIKRLDWLTALSRIGAVDEARTMFDDPLARLEELEQDWQGRSAPKTLSAYDIPLQWGIAGVCAAILAWMLFLTGKTVSKTFRFNPDTLALTLPDGRTIAPDDIAEFDKRQWHKYYITLRLNDGGAVRLDLFRYAPLEKWILAMEKQSAPIAGDADRAPDALQPEDSDDSSERA